MGIGVTVGVGVIVGLGVTVGGRRCLYISGVGFDAETVIFCVGVCPFLLIGAGTEKALAGSKSGFCAEPVSGSCACVQFYVIAAFLIQYGKYK